MKYEIVFGIIMFLVIIFKVKQGIGMQRKVLNILHAKYTFDQLGEEDKQAVKSVTYSILYKGGISNPERRLREFNNLQLYGLYALSMSELKIKPMTKMKNWSYISNPIIISKKLEKDIDLGIEIFNKDYGVILDFK